MFAKKLDSDSSMDSEEYVRDDGALLSLQPWIFRKEVHQDEQKRRDLSLITGQRRRYCAIPQLYNYFGVKGYALNSIPSSAAVPALRPLLITDGERMVGKSSYGRSANALETGLGEDGGRVCSGAARSAAGVPPLSELRRPKKSRGKMPSGGVCASSSAERGLIDGFFLFCLGISIGVMSTIISNRREVEKLNDILRDTKNLVQDLQEDLSMRDSVTVAELTNEPCENQELIDSPMNTENCINLSKNQTPVSICPTLDMDAYDQSHLLSVGEISESRSKMEAELQAELEILERSMSTSSLEQRMSSFSELDPDLITEVVHGDLRVDILERGSQETLADIIVDANSTSTMTTLNANYAVSPRELSLCLHELLNSRLEERVHELEKALHHSQRQLCLVEAAGLQRAFSSSDMGSYTNQESPRGMEAQSATIHPYCLNLSGDALDACDEAYEEFMMMTEVEEDNPSEKTGGEEFFVSDSSMIFDLRDSKVNKLTNMFDNGAAWEQVLESRISGDVPGSDSDMEDEEGRILIQQILKKTRCSPLLINAQMMPFSMDE